MVAEVGQEPVDAAAGGGPGSHGCLPSAVGVGEADAERDCGDGEAGVLDQVES